MDIEQAFTQQAIAEADTDVSGDDEVTVRRMIRRVCETQDPPVELQRDAENVAVLCFVAGRTYEQDGVSFNVPMDPETLAGFLHYLVKG